jgi:Fic family protein
MGMEKVHFEAPPSARVAPEMRAFIDWWEAGAKNTDGLVRAGIAHFYFVAIHPFEDGNGRIARALSEMALAQDENLSQRYYSLSARIMKESGDYYNVLERSSKGKIDITEWLTWFLSCFLRALEDSEVTISKVLKIAEFWQRHTQTALNKNQRKVINRLAEAGPGGFVGGLTTRKYTAMTGASRATAYRDISDLIKKSILIQNKGKGRSVSYNLVFPD